MGRTFKLVHLASKLTAGFSHYRHSLAQCPSEPSLQVFFEPGKTGAGPGVQPLMPSILQCMPNRPPDLPNRLFRAIQEISRHHGSAKHNSVLPRASDHEAKANRPSPVGQKECDHGQPGQALTLVVGFVSRARSVRAATHAECIVSALTELRERGKKLGLRRSTPRDLRRSSLPRKTIARESTMGGQFSCCNTCWP
jgi:hypothetical protein